MINKIYKTEKGKVIIAVNKSFSVDEALTEANIHFKCSKSKLNISDAWIKGSNLYFDEVKGGRYVWAVWKTL